MVDFLFGSLRAFVLILPLVMIAIFATWRRAQTVERRLAEAGFAERVMKVREQGRREGRDEALKEVAEDETDPFRQRARTLLGRCPNCNRSCIHCARFAANEH